MVRHFPLSPMLWRRRWKAAHKDNHSYWNAQLLGASFYAAFSLGRRFVAPANPFVAIRHTPRQGRRVRRYVVLKIADAGNEQWETRAALGDEQQEGTVEDKGVNWLRTC